MNFLTRAIEEVVLYTTLPEEAEILGMGIEDISETMKAKNVEVFEGEGGEYAVEGYSAVKFSLSS